MKLPADEPRSATGGIAAGGESAPPARPNDPASRSAHEMALGELRLQLEAWTRHEPGARLGGDPEELHQLRVSVRRIDAVLGLFKQQLPAELIRARRTAKGILRTLGAARDFDVQLAELDRYCESLSAAERVAAAPLRARLEADRAQARVRMIRVLDSEPTQQWLESLRLGSASSSVATHPGAAPAALVMPERVQKRFRKLRKDVRGLDAKSAMEKYHVVRRRAKLLRYALEPGAELFGKPAEEMLRALRRLQDGLGKHQDAHLAKSRLEAIAGDANAGLPPETLFLMGRLAEHQLKLTTKARKTLTRAWDKVRGKRWKTLRAKMDQVGAAALKAQERTSDAVVAQDAATTATTPGDPQPERAPAALARPLRH
jgi:CHAD domain-containing protein